jgi:hypothetical protein
MDQASISTCPLQPALMYNNTEYLQVPLPRIILTPSLSLSLSLSPSISLSLSLSTYSTMPTAKAGPFHTCGIWWYHGSLRPFDGTSTRKRAKLPRLRALLHSRPLGPLGWPDQADDFSMLIARYCKILVVLFLHVWFRSSTLSKLNIVQICAANFGFIEWTPWTAKRISRFF